MSKAVALPQTALERIIIMTAVIEKKTATSKKATVKKATFPGASAKKVIEAVTKVAPVDPAGNSGIPAPAPKGFDGRKVTLVTKTVPNRKLPAQALVILNTIEALGGTATQSEIVGAMLENGLKTVQSPKRIYTFYRKDLMEEGYITYA